MFKKLLKSWTIDFNLLVGSIVGVCTACGVVVSPELVAAVTTIGNVLLRLKTNKPISEK